MSDAAAPADRSPSRAADVLAVVALFALITIAFSDVWFRDSCFFIRDLTRYHFPMKRVLHDIVRGGEFPYWNRLYSAGQPAAANPEYEVFYPGQFPIFLRDFFLGFRLHILLHFYIAALAMYSLMRSLRAGVIAAVVTAIAFIFGGPLLSVSNLLPAFFGIVWLPFTILFARRFLIDRRAPDFVWAAVFVGLEAITFDPGVVPGTLVVLIALALWTGTDWRKRAIAVGFACAIFAAGLVIAAVQIVPTLAHVGDTPRSRGLTFDAVSYWSMPPLRLGELLNPRFSGRNPYLSDDYWGVGVYDHERSPYVQSLYIGCLFLVALITGILWRDRRTLAAAALAIAAWIAAFGTHTPLLRIAYALKLPMVTRFPERFALLAGFVLTIAAGLVLDRIVRDEIYRRTALRVASVLAIVSIVISAFTFTAAYPPSFARLWHAGSDPIVRHWIALSRIDWLLTAARAAALAIVFLVVRKMPARVVALLLAVFVLADLLQFTRELTPREPRSFFEAPAVTRELRPPSAGYRIFFEPEWSSGPTMRSYFANKPTSYWVIRNGMFPRLPAAHGFSSVFERDIDLTNVAWSDDLTEAMWAVRKSGRPDWAEVFSSMANVGYRAALRPFKQEVQQHPDPKQVEPVIFVPFASAPRYYFADEIVPVKSMRDFVGRMIRERHSRSAAYAPVAPFAPSAASIRGLSETANGADLDVEAAGRAFLVASVTWHRNWRATIDGTTVPITRTNVSFQGIEVPPGRHRIAFRYADASIVAGAAITIVSLMACVVVLVFGRTPRERVSAS